MDEEKRKDEPGREQADEQAISERIAREVEAARAQWESEVTAKVEKARAEAERLARMTEGERADAEMAEREKRLAEREKALLERELREQTVRRLEEKGLPGELADAVNCADEKACEASILALERAFRAAVEAGIIDRMKGAPPVSGRAVKSAGELSDDEYYLSRIGTQL